MTKHRTRIIGSALAGTGAAALVVAGMAFGLPAFDDDGDPALADSTRARQALRQRDAATPGVAPWRQPEARQAKTGEQTLPAQAAAGDGGADAGVAAAVVAAPAVVAAAAEQPTSAASPIATGEREWSDDDHEDGEHDEHGEDLEDGERGDDGDGDDD